MVLSECEMYDDALQMAKRATRLRRKSVGVDHISICECKNMSILNVIFDPNASNYYVKGWTTFFEIEGLNNMGAIYLSRGRLNRASEK